MPRTARHAPGDTVYHVLNRAHERRLLFESDADYAAFERVLGDTIRRAPIRICAYCLMPNHWHLLLWTLEDGDLSVFMQRLTVTHARRWIGHRRAVGQGALYQGRFKAFPVETDSHFLTVCRYVERNPVRARLVARAEDWRWSSCRRHKDGGSQTPVVISEWPVTRPTRWLDHVNTPEVDDELRAVRDCCVYGRPFGSPNWVKRIVDG